MFNTAAKSRYTLWLKLQKIKHCLYSACETLSAPACLTWHIHLLREDNGLWKVILEAKVALIETQMFTKQCSWSSCANIKSPSLKNALLHYIPQKHEQNMFLEIT